MRHKFTLDDKKAIKRTFTLDDKKAIKRTYAREKKLITSGKSHPSLAQELEKGTHAPD